MMTRGTVSEVRGALIGAATAFAFFGAVFGLAATGPANAAPNDPDPGFPTSPDDPRCASMSYLAQCQGGPYTAAHAPMGPADTACISMPTDPVCAGGPYAIPPPAPALPPMAGPPMEGPRMDAPRMDAPPIEAPRPPVIPEEHMGGMPDEHVGGGMPGHI